MVAKVNDLQAASAKVGDMMKQAGLVQLQPDLADPLGALQRNLNILQGVNTKGDLAVAWYTQEGPGAPLPMAAIPVSDYRAFIGNFTDVKNDGKYDRFTLFQPMFCVNRGGYAVVAANAELLDRKADGVQVGGVAGKLMDDRCVSFYLNMKALQPMALPMIRMVKAMAANQPRNPQGPGPSPFALAMASQMFGAVEQFVEQDDSLVLCANITREGLTTTMLAEFAPDSAIGKNLAGVTGSDSNVLLGLPSGKLLAAGGWAMDGAQLWKAFDWYIEVLKAAKLPEDQAKVLAENIEATKAMMAATKGASFALIAPPADAKTGLLRGSIVFRGDAKAMVAAQAKAMETQNAVMQAMGETGMNAKASVTRAAKTIDGVTLDLVTVEVSVNPNRRELAPAQKMIDLLYGAGLKLYVGAVNDSTFFEGINLDDQQLAEALAAAKQASPAVGDLPAVKAAAARLPVKRIAVGYLWLGQILTTVGDVAAQLGQPLPVKMPGDMPPLAMSLGAEGAGVRVDTVIPIDMVKGIVDLVMQARDRPVRDRPARPRPPRPAQPQP